MPQNGDAADDGDGDAAPKAAPSDALSSEELAERKMRFLFALRSNGVTDSRVLHAMEKIDRGLFVKGHFADHAYEDMPLPIPCGQTISQPSVVGRMSQALEIGPRDKVLEVGTGSGYQAAILSQLARRVYTVERFRDLTLTAQEAFDALALTNVIALTGDGALGISDQAPFDRILVTAAAEDPPGPLLAQLREGGIMVVPVGRSDAVQRLIKVRRGAGGLEYEELIPVRFVPLLEGLGQS
ncbi:MAG: protein-L-isoaspartate(D-aspartate) O-methyltransferase [Pseudomonadota bacterium]